MQGFRLHREQLLPQSQGGFDTHRLIIQPIQQIEISCSEARFLGSEQLPSAQPYSIVRIVSETNKTKPSFFLFCNF